MVQANQGLGAAGAGMSPAPRPPGPSRSLSTISSDAPPPPPPGGTAGYGELAPSAIHGLPDTGGSMSSPKSDDGNPLLKSVMDSMAADGEDRHSFNSLHERSRRRSSLAAALDEKGISTVFDPGAGSGPSGAMKPQFDVTSIPPGARTLPWRRSGARSTGVSKVREAVLEACQRLNRPVEESAKALQYLESEWLCDAWTLGALSEEAWKELRLPLGLKEHLRFRFRGTAWAAEARPASPGWARLDAEKPVAMVFQDDRRPPEVPQPREKSSVEALLVRIQEKMSRENRSLKGMARRFKRMDDDAGTSHGEGDRQQFLQIFKPKLSERRRLAVNALFDHLDANRNGVIQIDDLKLRCDPNALAEGVHKVRGVRMQPDQVLVNFLENFRKLVGGSAWDLPSNFFHHLEVDEKPNHISAGTPARVRVIPHHQHHNPTFLDHQQGGHERRGQAHTGQRLLRTLRRCLAQCCRGNASLLYGDLVVRTYVPNPRRGEEAPPKLVPKETFEAVLLRMLPSMLPPDPPTAGCPRPRPRQAPTAVRQDCALRVFDDLAGAGATNLDLSDAARVIPPGAMTVFGDRQVSLQSWLDFHNLVATAAGETTDAVYEAQLRYLWGLRDANSQGPKLTPVPGYYRGMSRGGLSKLFPKYILETDAGVFLMAAKKQKNNKTSKYVITMSKTDDSGKDEEAFLGKLRSNFLGLEFMAYGEGMNPKKSLGCREFSMWGMLIDSSMSQVHALQLTRQELLAVQYSSSLWGTKPRGPRKMGAVREPGDGRCDARRESAGTERKGTPGWT
eukprot:g31858.t1